MAALDVAKAFDRVHHADLFGSLLRCGVGMRIVSTLKTFYADIRAKVFLWAGAESSEFKVEGGSAR